MNEKILERWESKNRKHWAILYLEKTGGYFYMSPGAGGYLGEDLKYATEEMKRKVESGYFLPDSYKTKMIRTK